MVSYLFHFSNFIINIIALIFISVMSEAVACDEFTKLCEDNKPCEIMFVWKKSFTSLAQFTWSQNGQNVGTCYLDNECQKFQEFNKDVSLSVQNSEGFITFNVTLHGLDLNQGQLALLEGKWELNVSFENNTSLMIFNLTVNFYKSNTELTCSHAVSSEAMEIHCTSLKTYPKNICLFKVIFEKRIVNFTGPFYSYIWSSPIYFNTRCYISINSSLLKHGQYDYEVIMAPNISFVKKAAELGIKYTKSIVLEFPKLRLIDCDNDIQEGKLISCTCQRVDKSEINTRVFWFLGDKLLSSGANSSILKSRAEGTILEYVCMAKNNLNWHFSVTYTPQNKIKRKNCSQYKPFYCDTKCYGYDEFCNVTDVQSCFPNDVRLENLLDWCRTTGLFQLSAMAHQTCCMACQTRFGEALIKHDGHKILHNIDSLMQLSYSIIIALVIIIVMQVAICCIVIQYVSFKKEKEKKEEEKAANDK